METASSAKRVKTEFFGIKCCNLKPGAYCRKELS